MSEQSAESDAVDHAAEHHAMTGNAECWCIPCTLADVRGIRVTPPGADR